MADSIKEATEATANLHLDEETGERVSKSELKKRQKQRQVEAKKKEKEAAQPPAKAQKKASAEEMEADLSPNVSYCPCSAVLRPGN
jgi:lysyl-tRNA synthetase class 2